jgi:hypothetical protein
MMIDLDDVQDGTKELLFSAFKWFINGMFMGAGWLTALKLFVWLWD